MLGGLMKYPRIHVTLAGMMIALCATLFSQNRADTPEYVVYQNVPNHRAAMRIQQLPNHTNIVLSTDAIFQVRSPQFQKYGTRHLDHVLDFIVHQTNHQPHITIDAYYSQAGAGVKKLTQQQAANIAAYFWSRGFNRRAIKYHGHGQHHPVSTNDLPSGTADNRRIEINIY